MTISSVKGQFMVSQGLQNLVRLGRLRALSTPLVGHAAPGLPVLPTLPSAQLPSMRQGCLSQHLSKVPNIFLLHHRSCQAFEDNVKFTQHSLLPVHGTKRRDGDQLVNLAESSMAVISPGCFLGLINTKEKELCWKI